MSNRPRLRPSHLAGSIRVDRAPAARYTCGHCAAWTRTTRAGRGVVLLDVFHDETCPVLGGSVSGMPDFLRAVHAAEARGAD